MIMLGAPVLFGSDGPRIEIGAGCLSVMIVMFVERDRIAGMLGKVRVPGRGRCGQHQRAGCKRHEDQERADRIAHDALL